MSYDKNHTEDECDKCLKNVGKDNLFKCSFLYLDKNDNVHTNESIRIIKNIKDDLIKKGVDEFTAETISRSKVDTGYRQYNVCKECVGK